MKLLYIFLKAKSLRLALLAFCFTLSASLNATSYVWNGSVSTQWGDAANWTPAGIPDIGDDVTINSQTNNPVFEEVSGLNNFTLNSGSLNLSAFTIVLYGTANFNGGTISNGNISFVSGSDANFNGTAISCGVSGALRDVYFNGSTFDNAVSLTRSSSNDVICDGGNTFKSTFSLTNAGTGSITFANIEADIFKSLATFSVSNTGLILPAYSATGTEFQGGIQFNSSGTSLGIRLGQNGGTSTLSSGQTFSIGGSGFSVGDLRLKNFTQTGTTTQTLTLSGNAAMYIESGCTFNADVSFSSPHVYINGATFQGATSITKTSSGNNQSLGGNTFNGATTIISNGSGDFILGVSNADSFNSTSVFTNTGSGTLFVAHVASGTTFADDIQVNSTGSSKGVRFGQTGGSSTLASGKTITVGGSGFTAGSLRLRNFTQTGSTAQSFNITSGTASLYLETGTTFNGAVNFTFPQLYLSGSTFASSATLVKGGATDNTGSGGNTFSSTTTIANSGSGRLILGSTNPDTFEGNLTVTSSGSSVIQLAQTSSGNVFNGNIIINSTGSSQGVKFGQNGGSSVLADSKTLTIGGLGFSNGDLAFKGLTQTGTTSQSITELTGSASLLLEAGTVFNGDVTFESPRLFLNGATFNSIASFTKNSSLSDASDGGNTFNANVEIFNTADGEMILGNSNPDIFNGNLTLENSGSDAINLAYGSTGNEFNGNIVMNSTGTSAGIRFGQNAGTSSLASGKTISIGGSGFTSGDLRLAYFVQNGSTSQTLTSFGANVELYLSEGTEFNGSSAFTCPNIYLDGTTFNNSTTIVKTGSGFNLSNGGNIFGGTTSISNTGTGSFILAGTVADTYNENVTFLQTNAYTLYPAYNVNSNFKKNISTVGSNTAVVFGSNGGRVTMNGTAAQFINGDAAKMPDFFNLTLNKASNHVTLNVPILVTNNLTFSSGNLISNSINLVKLLDNSTVTGVSNSSHVDGTVRKEGNDAFTFPIGKSGYYRPIGISAPSSTSDHFTAEFNFADSDGAYAHSSKDASLDHLSRCEFWILNRTAGSSSVSVTMTWNGTSCGVSALSDLRVARWDGSMWKDHGNGGTTGNTSVGSIASGSTISSFSPFSLGSITTENPLPIELVSFAATPLNNQVNLNWTTASETNNDYFTVESSNDAVNFKEVSRMSGAGNSNSMLTYSTVDTNPYSGVSYYRLKQVDYDGKFVYSNIEVVNLNSISEMNMVVSPNPVIGLVDIRLDSDYFANPTIEVRDLQGRILLVKNNLSVSEGKSVNVDLSELPQGLYFIQASENGKSISKRIVKN
jgi:hypothetical protein